MADAVMTPTAVQVNYSETTIYTAPGATSFSGFIRFSNSTSSQRLLNVFCYTGGGPGSDSNRAWPKDFSLLQGQAAEINFELPTGYKVTATCDAANGITAIPFGIETT